MKDGKQEKKIMALLATVCMGTLCAEEILRIETPEDFKRPTGISREGDMLVVKGPARFFSVRRVKTDPSKKYKLSGEFRLRSGSPVQVRLGYAAADSKNRTIFPLYVNVVPDTETETAASVRRGRNVIMVKDASKWRKSPAVFYVAFDACDDFSDLPNRSVIKIAKDGVKQNGDVWEITLAQPLKMNLPEGTKVRQHSDGATYIWNTGVATLQDRWISRTGILSGIVKTGNPPKKLWPGTASIQIILSLSGKADSVTEIRNIRVEEVER